jgi:hypothetical protein
MPGILIGSGVIKANMQIGSKPLITTAIISNTYANRDKVVITFDQNLNSAIVPDTSAFALSGKTITNVGISGAVVTLTISVAYDYGNTATAVYTKPATNPLTALVGGGKVDSFSQAVTNNIVYLSLLSDGNTAGLYMFQDTASITQVSNEISRWNDHLGSGHDLLQATGGKQPTLQATGVRLVRANGDFMKAGAFALSQPISVYVVIKQVSWTATTYVLDGNTSNTCRILCDTATPGLSVSAGASSPVDNGLAVGVWGILRICYNGVANSSFQINAGAKWTGNCFTNNMGGLTLNGRGTDGALPADTEVKELIVRSIDDTPTNEGLIYNYLKAKYSL